MYSFTGERKATCVIKKSLEILYTTVFRGKVKICVVIFCCDHCLCFPSNSGECNLNATLSLQPFFFPEEEEIMKTCRADILPLVFQIRV